MVGSRYCTAAPFVIALELPIGADPGYRKRVSLPLYACPVRRHAPCGRAPAAVAAGAPGKLRRRALSGKGGAGQARWVRDVVGHRRGRIHRIEYGREPQRGRADRYRGQRRARRRRQMAQSRQAPARRRGAARGTDRLARRPQARRRHPSRRDLRHHRHRRRSRPRHQFPPLAPAARLVHGDAHAVHLRLVGRDLWRRRRGLRRRLVAGGVAAAAADESLRLEQASVRPRGRRSLRQGREAAAAMGGPEVLQRVRPERVPQGRDDEPGRQALRRGEGRQTGAAVQVAPRRHRRRRAEARLHLRRRRGRGGALAARDAARCPASSTSAPARRAASAT